jgi:hypothetical protein
VAQGRRRHTELRSGFGKAPFSRDREEGKEIVEALSRHL